MTEVLKTGEDKKERLKALLKRIQKGEKIEHLKAEFKEVLENLSPLEIPLIEQELVREGVPAREIAKMCDIHVEIFRGTVTGAGKEEIEGIPEGHPLKTLYLENRAILKDAELLNLYAGSLKTAREEGVKADVLGVIEGIINDLKKVGPTHYTREEMLIFPYIERLGLTAIASVLWTKHDEIRYMIRYLTYLISKRNEMKWEDFLEKFESKARKASFALSDMVFREDNIFYPTIKALLSEAQWKAIRVQESDVGYYKVDPPLWDPGVEPVYPWEMATGLTAEQILSLPGEVQQVIKGQPLTFDKTPLKRKGDIDLETGYLNLEELKAIFDALPVDVTFIDSEDRVRFFSAGERIFTRTISVLGRPVQRCHPPKSVHLVNKILKAFKEGRKKEATFWLKMGPKYVYIKYVPLFDKKGEYRGTLELSMDIAPYRTIEGERKLLSWKD